ncbi:MAG: AzlD domain-containing protein [Methylobacteriaceae bacterium]|nr:AzlD domain-containing protein [Methylobacteriaceae bacterium]
MSVGWLVDPAVAPLAAMLILAAAPNLILRVVGVLLSRGIDEQSEALAFVRGLALALLAGVVGKLIANPPGALAATTTTGRIGAILIAVAAFFLARRSIFAALLAGEATLIASLALR